MASKLNLTPGTVLSEHTVQGVGTPVAGHACWLATCNHCQITRNVRGSLLHKGLARCPCQSKRAPATSLAARLDTLEARIAFLEGRSQTFSPPAPAPAEARPVKLYKWDEAVAEARQLSSDKAEPQRIRQLLARMLSIIDFADLDKQPAMLDVRKVITLDFNTWADKP